MQVLAFGDRLAMIRRLIDAFKDLDLSQIAKLWDMLSPLIGMLTGPQGAAMLELVRKLVGLIGAPAAQSVEVMAADFEAQAASLGFDLARLDAFLQLVEKIIALIRGITAPAA